MSHCTDGCEAAKLRPTDKPFQVSDGGLFVEVMPGGAMPWRMRYRLCGKQEKVTLGDYPGYSLADARQWREDCAALVERGVSPMAIKRGDTIPDGVAVAVKERAQKFIDDWCMHVRKKIEAKAAEARTSSTVKAFAVRWFIEVAEPSNSNPRNIRRILDIDVIPAIGEKQVADVTVTDMLAITDKIKARGADQMALQARNVMKRLFAFGIARELTKFNPAAAVEAQFIATAKSRDVALSSGEVGRLLRSIYVSSMKRANKLALRSAK